MSSGKLQREPLTGRNRPAWDLEMSVDILEDIADGKTLKEATFPRVPGRVKASTFLYWCLRVPELQEAYRLAREMSGHMLEDEALDLARGLPKLGGPAVEVSAKVRAVDVAMNHLRWAAGKRHPKEYGDKAQTTFTVPIQINTSIPLEPGMKSVAGEGREEFVIEVRPTPSLELQPTIYDAKRRDDPPRPPGWNLDRDRPPPGRARPSVAAAHRRFWDALTPEERAKRVAKYHWKKKEAGDVSREVPGSEVEGRQEPLGELGEPRVGGLGQAGGEPMREPGVVHQGDGGGADAGGIAEPGRGGEDVGLLGDNHDTEAVDKGEAPSVGKGEDGVER